MVPDAMAGLIAGFVVIFATTCGVCCIQAIQSPIRFEKKASVKKA
jgi:hypothetical protein